MGSDIKNLKVLIIDDNYSFIELLRSKLSPFLFQFDAAHHFEQAERKLNSNRSIFNKNLYNSITAKAEEFQRWKNSGQNGPSPKLNSKLKKIKNVLNPEGYSLIFVENRTEHVSGGIKFINDMASTIKDFEIDQFILLTNRLKEVEEEASQFKIPCFDKEIRNQKLFKFIKQKVEELEGRVQRENLMFNWFQELKELQSVDTTPKKNLQKSKHKQPQKK